MVELQFVSCSINTYLHNRYGCSTPVERSDVSVMFEGSVLQLSVLKLNSGPTIYTLPRNNKHGTALDTLLASSAANIMGFVLTSPQA